MALRIGLNGFGRIGRYLTRLLADDERLQIAAVNARADNESLAHLLKYDSVHGRFQGEVLANDQGFSVNGRQVVVTREGMGQWQWKDLGVDIVVESTGKIKTRAGLASHIECGAKKVVISAPCADADISIVMGVNHSNYDPKNHAVISNASCTTNCLAPAAKILNDHLTIKSGLMTTIHSYTMSQRLLDGSHKDMRRGRAAGINMTPTTTGAARALGHVIPALKGKMDGLSIRVPTPDVSIVDLTCHVEKATSIEEVNAILKAAAEGEMRDYMGYSDEPLVSTDYIGSIYGGVVDAECTMVMDGTMVKVMIWYDNEAGFTNQLLRLLRHIGSSCGLDSCD